MDITLPVVAATAPSTTPATSSATTTTTIGIAILIAACLALLIWVIVLAVRNARDDDETPAAQSSGGSPDYTEDVPGTGFDDGSSGSSSSNGSSTVSSTVPEVTSTIALRVADLYGNPIALMGVWDRSGTYLGATDVAGNVTITMRHAYQLSATQVTVHGEGISPEDTAYHCTRANISLTPSGLSQRQTIVVGSASLLTYNGAVSRMESVSAFLRGDDSVANATTQDGSPAMLVRYSFVQAGQAVEAAGLTALRLGEHVDGSYAMTEAQFKDEIHAGFAAWNEVFAALWPTRPLVFAPVDDPDGASGPKSLGDEASASNPTVVYGSYSLTGGGNMGDIRISMIHMEDGSPVLAYAYGPWNTGEYSDIVGVRGSFGSDMMFNAAVDWRRDVELATAPAAQRDGYSVRYVFAHEFGHALGLGHDASVGALMAPYANEHDSLAQRFPGGIVTSASDMAALQALYNAASSTPAFELRQGNCAAYPVF